MKLKLTLMAAVAAAMTLATTKATAVSFPSMPSPRINISGTIVYQGPTQDNGTTSSGTLKTLSFNSKTLINLLNASPAATNSIMDVTGTNQIPPGSFFIWDAYSEALAVTNVNGFDFPLYAYDYVAGQYYDYGYLDFDEDVLIGAFSLNDATGAGSEVDQTGVEFYFDDGNGTDIDPEYGNGVFHWSYGPVGTGQKMSMSFSAQPAGYYAETGGTNGITRGMSLSAAGSGTFAGFGEPFYQWW